MVAKPDVNGKKNGHPPSARPRDPEAMLEDVDDDLLLADSPGRIHAGNLDVVAGLGDGLDDGLDVDALEDGLDDDIASAPEPALLGDGPGKDERIDPVLLVATDLDVPVEWVDAVRRRVMQMDPVGVLSRDLGECLLAQLAVWGYDDECLVWQVVSHHM